ncbi:MAG: PKD domain-containing protein [Candidatus Kapabacteria bacterium]|nr:PKD domain-containing protein [Candidatus Kapabacteria bacterium]
MKRNFSIFRFEYLLIIIGIFLIYCAASAQISSKGKDYWLGFLPNEVSFQAALSINIVSEQTSVVVVSIPGCGWSNTFTVQADSVKVVKIPEILAMVKNSEIAEPKSIHIVSNNDISVYAFNYVQASFDASLILPTSALGKSYYVLTYSSKDFYTISEFIIVATDVSSTITIVPTQNTVNGHLAGIPFNITLKAGELYLVQSLKDLSGSYISSLGTDNNFACFAGNKCAFVPETYSACDHLYEQMQPVRAWGSNYIAIPFQGRNKGDSYRILASADSTKVFLNSNLMAIINKGRFYETIIDSASLISANNPVEVAQFSNSGSYDGVLDSDPFYIMLSPVEQFVSNITFGVYTAKTINYNFLNIATRSSDTSAILFDGKNIFGWSRLSHDSVHSSASIIISKGSHSLIADSSTAGFNAYVYGYGSYESYGYAAGINLEPFFIDIPTFNTCVNKEVQFRTKKDNFKIKKYLWSFGDGQTSTESSPLHLFQKSGVYPVQLIATDEFNEIDTAFSTVVIAQVKANYDYIIQNCDFSVDFKDKSLVENSQIATYHWDFDDGYISRISNPTHTFSEPGKYNIKLLVISNNGCIDTISKTIEIFKKTEYSILPNKYKFCQGDSVILKTFPDSTNYSYQWSNGEKTKSIVVTDAGNYQVKITNQFACIDSASISIAYFPTISAKIDSVFARIGDPNVIIKIHCKLLNFGVGLLSNIHIHICLDASAFMPDIYQKYISENYVDNLGQRNLIFDVNNLSLKNTDTLNFQIKGMALLADNLINPIKFIEISSNNVDLCVDTYSGKFVLDSICAYKIRKIQNLKATSFNIIPNPANADEIQVKFEGDEEGNHSLTFYDLQGQIIDSRLWQNSINGDMDIKFDLKNYSIGLYYIVLKSPWNVISKPLIILK